MVSARWGHVSHRKEQHCLFTATISGKLISRFGDVEWPPRSPDLSPPDYFLWAYLKDRVYVNRPRSIEKLKNNIRTEIQAISSEILGKVVNGILDIAQECVACCGGHVKDIVFRM